MEPRKAFSFVVLLLLLLCLVPTPGVAAAGSLSDPIELEIDGPTGSLGLSPASPEAWFEIRGDLHGVSHLLIETSGDESLEIALYRNTADAVADRWFAEDSGYSASIEWAAGYRLPWLLRTRFQNAADSGTVSASVTSSFSAPATCSGAGPCPFSVASRGRSGGRALLATMRGVRSFLLTSTEPGTELIGLYYRISRELLPEVLLDERLRNDLHRLGSSVAVPMREALKVGLGDPSSYVISPEAIAAAREMSNRVAIHVSPSLAHELDSWTTRLESLGGEPIESAMSKLGLLAEPRSTHTLPSDSVYPVRRGELIVKFHRQVTPTSVTGRVQTGLDGVDAALLAFDVTEMEAVFETHGANDAGNLDRIYRVLTASAEATDKLIAALRGTPEIEYVSRVPVGYLNSDDLYYPYQYGPQAINATTAWSTPVEGSPLIGVIDTGIDHRQADLAGRTRTEHGWNYVDDSSDAMDDHGHGSHVAGTIAAAVDNVYSVAGICPQAEVIPYKVCSADGSCDWLWVAQSLAAAAQVGAKVVNMSLGGPFDQTVEDALEHAAGEGVLLIAAAGNDGQDGSSFPGSSTYTLSIGATDENNELASFSNYGDIDLVAPGVDIVNLGLEAVSCYSSGTSMATPHAVGAAALVASRKPAISRSELEDSLIMGASDIGDPGYDPQFGHGLVDVLHALFGDCPEEITVDLENHTVSGAENHTACARITAGPAVEVTETGNLTLTAGLEVVLQNGFSVSAGGSFTAVIEPTLGDPY